MSHHSQLPSVIRYDFCSWYCISKYTRTIRKVTTSELLTKQAMRQNIYYIRKNTYILTLLLDVVTAGIEALVSGNQFLHAPVKEFCRL
jgi:hypothetical protein